mmetsp:Transcript_12353/g.24012  ORF Transcript_12353/g.24012 Transcript_12353/m.24012 type:complete len:204 (-) Transcript_12353:178-789(-)
MLIKRLFCNLHQTRNCPWKTRFAFWQFTFCTRLRLSKMLKRLSKPLLHLARMRILRQPNARSSCMRSSTSVKFFLSHDLAPGGLVQAILVHHRRSQEATFGTLLASPKQRCTTPAVKSKAWWQETRLWVLSVLWTLPVARSQRRLKLLNKISNSCTWTPRSKAKSLLTQGYGRDLTAAFFSSSVVVASRNTITCRIMPLESLR